ncbi:MAG TPA: NAD-dependent epimerase/dehydratase family protein [Rugosimonospora sp.]
MALRVVFLGGAGMIASACAAEAVRAGVDLTVVTRTGGGRWPVPDGARQVRADVRDPAALREALGGADHDVVVDWVGYSPADVARDVDAYAGRVGQYVFISTASVFSRPVPQLPVTESSPRRNNAWPYPKDKLDCETLLEAAYRERDFPVTIVRPAHVYDRTVVPVLAGWTAVDRMRRGRPAVVHGDGTSLWNLTHSGDFARAFVPLLGNQHALGESVNVTSGEILTWDQIHQALAAAAGAPPRLAHRSSETIETEIPNWGPVLRHDFAHSLFFDSTKLLRLVPGFASRVPFSAGAREIIEWYDADPARKRVDPILDAAFDRLVD